MKDLHKRLDQLGKLRNPETRKRLKRFRKAKNKEEKLERSKTLLEKLWQRLLKKGPTKQNLWYIIRNVKRESLQVKAWQELSKREDHEFNDFYEAFDQIDKIDNPLKEKICKKGLELATPDDLLCMIRFKETFFRKKAWDELLKRLQKELVGKNQAKQILLQIIEFVPELSNSALEEFEKLDPSYQELSQIYSFPYIHSVPFLPEKLQNLLRRKLRKKEPNVKLIIYIHTVAEDLAKLEKGQT